MKFASPERRLIKFLTSIKFPFTFSVKDNYLISLIVCLNLAITVPLAAILNIWTDEAYSLDTTAKSLQYAISQAINFELQPPLYFALLNIWRSINDSIFWARLFSIICIILTIYVLALLSERWIKTIHPVWIVTTFAFNPLVIKMALEIRVYAFCMLLSALLLLFFYDGYFSDRSTTKAKVLYILFSILALYTQYYLGYLLVANAVILLISKRWKPLVHYLLGMSLIAICFLPMLSIVFEQVSDHTQYAENNLFIQNYFSLKTFKIKQLLAIFDHLPKLTKRNLYISIAFLFLTFMSLFKRKQLITWDFSAIWILNIVSFCFFTSVFFATQGILFDRHTVGAFIILLLAVFLLFSLIKNSQTRKLIVIIWTIAIMFKYSWYLSDKYSPLAKSGDWKRVSEHIMYFEKPEQEILVYDPINAVELSYYYDGINTIVPIPQTEDFKIYDIKKYALNNEQEIAEALEKNHDFLWLIVKKDSKFSKINVNLNTHILEDFVSKHYEVVNSKNFYKSQVRLLQRK